MIVQGRTATVLAVVLALSLVANFVAAGFILSTTTFGRHEGGPSLSISNSLLLAGRRFPPEIRAGMRQAFEAEPERVRAAFRALKAARQATFEAMRAEPFDLDRLNAAFALERQRTTELQEVGQAALARAVAAATPAERAAIGDRRPRRDEDRENRREERQERSGDTGDGG